jgi:hypothetical protein
VAGDYYFSSHPSGGFAPFNYGYPLNFPRVAYAPPFEERRKSVLERRKADERRWTNLPLADWPAPRKPEVSCTSRVVRVTRLPPCFRRPRKFRLSSRVHRRVA